MKSHWLLTLPDPHQKRELGRLFGVDQAAVTQFLENTVLNSVAVIVKVTKLLFSETQHKLQARVAELISVLWSWTLREPTVAQWMLL